eukprot:TRINITY_DN2459_c0_g2_i1.p1 TRINITY_DN2459_c0_g2~~TRINITY_DN2459_c0_g2_i1.p1  ORF type:complete len:1265 (+),score=434.83 TRINITY_DN2459_c0_g2_i1:32-3796(+)
MSDTDSESLSCDRRVGAKRKREDEGSEIHSCSEDLECGMQCWVIAPSGEEHALVVDADDTVRVLRSRVKRVVKDLHSGKHVLAFNGRVLKDLDEAVSELGLDGDSRIEVRYTPKFLANDALKNRYKLPCNNMTLHKAVVDGKLELVKTLLTAGLSALVPLDEVSDVSDEEASLGESTEDNMSLSAFCLAAKYNHMDILKYIITVCEPEPDEVASAFVDAVNKGSTNAALHILTCPLSLDRSSLFTVHTVNLRVYTGSNAKRKEFEKIFNALIKKFSLDLKKKGTSVEVLRWIISCRPDLPMLQWVVAQGVNVKDEDNLGNVFDTNMSVDTDQSIITYLLDQNVIPTAKGMEKLAQNDMMTIDVLKQLVAKGCDPNNAAVYHLAARSGHLDVVKYLIEEAKIDINMVDEEGDNALFNVISSYDEEEANGTEVIEYLISKGISVTDEGWRSYTPLDEAASQPCIPAMRAILRSLPKKSKEPIKLNVREWPDGMRGFYEFILEQNFDLNRFDREGHTILSTLAYVDTLDDEENDSLDDRIGLIKKMVKKGADINLVAEHCPTNTMTFAASCGDEFSVQMVKLLRKLGGDVNLKQPNGETPLHVAGSEAIMRYLLSLKEVDVNAKDCQGRTPLITHLFRHNDAIAKTLEAMKLRKADIDFNAKDMVGNSAIFACRTVQDLKTMIELGADYKAVNSYGMSLLSWAVDMKMIRYEVDELGLDPHHKDNNGMTVFMHLLMRGSHDEMLQEFISEYDPDMHAVDNDGNTVPMLYVHKNSCALFEKTFGGKKKEKFKLETTTNFQGKTVYHFVNDADNAFAKTLLSLDVADKNGETPLMTYVLRGGTLPNGLFRSDKLFSRNEKTGATVLMMLVSARGSGVMENVDFTDPRIDFDDADNEGKTLLMYLAEKRVEHVDWPEKLSKEVAKKASVNKRDKKGNTVLHYAAAADFGNMEVYFNQPFSAELDVRAVNNDGNNFLMKALLTIEDGYISTDMLKYIEKHWPDLLSAKNDDGICAGYLLVQSSEDDIDTTRFRREMDAATCLKAYSTRCQFSLTNSQWVLDKVRVTDKDAKGRTLLHYAVIAQREFDVLLLLRKGADPNVKDKYGRTPLFYVSDSVYAMMLKKVKADPSCVDVNGCSVIDQKQFSTYPDLLESLYHVFPCMRRGNPSYAAYYCKNADTFCRIFPLGPDYTYTPPADVPALDDAACYDSSGPSDADEVEILKVATGMTPPQGHHIKALDWIFQANELIRRTKGKRYKRIRRD